MDYGPHAHVHNLQEFSAINLGYGFIYGLAFLRRNRLTASEERSNDESSPLRPLNMQWRSQGGVGGGGL